MLRTRDFRRKCAFWVSVMTNHVLGLKCPKTEIFGLLPPIGEFFFYIRLESSSLSKNLNPHIFGNINQIDLKFDNQM